MGLLGRHTRQPYGNPAALTAISEAAARGDETALRNIAGGRRATGIRGINDSYNYGENTPSGAAYRQYAQALLAGDTTRAQGMAQQAGATYRPWSGGLLADLAPAIVGAAGSTVGLPPALTGAATGALMSAGGVTNRSALAGAGLGALAGAAGAGAARGLAGGGLTGAARSLGIPTSATGVLGAASQRLGTGGGILGTGLTGGDVLAGVGAYQGAQRQGQANALREQALGTLQPGQRPDLSAVFADPGNPYQQPRSNTALAAARGSLRGY